MKNEDREQHVRRFLSFREVQQLTGLSRSTLYRQMKLGMFPKARSISTRKVGFLEKELELWIQERKVSE